MEPHQERVVTEKSELDAKIDKLLQFIRGATYKTLAVDERVRLNRQLSYMTDYSNILGERIAAF